MSVESLAPDRRGLKRIPEKPCGAILVLNGLVCVCQGHKGHSIHFWRGEHYDSRPLEILWGEPK